MYDVTVDVTVKRHVKMLSYPIGKPVITLGGQEANIRRLLDDINTSDNVPPQPEISGAPIAGQGAEGSWYDEAPRPQTARHDHRSHRHRNTRPNTAIGNRTSSGYTDNMDEDYAHDGNKARSNVAMEMTDMKEETMEGVPDLEELIKMEKEEMDQIIDMVESNKAIVISGETGCGKTTQVPQFILDHYIEQGKGSECRVICTQPRRISAVSVAERVADERGESISNSVGYSIRLESKFPRSTGSILFCTTGVLLKYLESDPQLYRATHIIVDEIHERDLLSDFLLIILKDLLQKRPDLKVILMSATLNAEQFSEYFYNCPHLSIPGFTYPVQEYYLENILEMTGYIPPDKDQGRKKFHDRGRGKWREREEELEEEEWNVQAWCRSLEGKFSPKTIDSLSRMDLEMKILDLELIYNLIRHIVSREDDGAILVFVPGWSEISDLHKLLMKDRFFNTDKVRVIPLHSMMPTVNQKEVFDRAPPGVRKIVIATNIAETSITIDDVVYVINGGKIKMKDFEPEYNMTSLEARWVSKSNAKQRRGRAGRVQPGKCYHLYTSLKETTLEDYQRPEILRTRLEELCLQIKLLKLGRIEPFVSKAMQRPSTEALRMAIENLQNLQALDENENLLPLGVHLAKMPVDPHSGKMLLFGAMFGCLSPVCTVAASLSFKDAFVIPLGKEKLADMRRKELSEGSKSDHIMLINAFDGWEHHRRTRTDGQYCWENFLSGNTLKLLQNMKKQFAEVLRELKFVRNGDVNDPSVNVNSANMALVKAVICAGLYPNVARVMKVPSGRSKFPKPPKVNLKDGQRVSIHLKSVNSDEKDFPSKWLVYHKVMKTNGVNLFDCTMVSPYPLLFFGGEIKSSMMKVNDHEERHMVTVDDWISFYASPTIGQLVKDLRKQLDRLLEDKITRPGVTNWDPKSKEGAVLKAIIDVITQEDFDQDDDSDWNNYHGGRDRYR
ncbi:hypothetical protein FSP39_005663 [Pinctada imbricata]|uniref:RNA helicase n=1 Tax=Pinctada imbricata TaxID=66713 RepID=A0AA89C190_PINIB|nr:hypothetical protein FSP39_005663 [Pinctada imbricata]